MFIYIARHAWAGERGDPRWPDDSLRELTPQGIARYGEVVKSLAQRGFAPARIATSPYVRWAGHSPDVDRFAATLIGDSSARIRFAKGAVAAIEFDDDVFAGGGELY